MSENELHDLLAELKEQRSGADLVDAEYQQRLDDIVESLEQQRLYPDTFDQYSVLSEQIQGLLDDYREDHPTIDSLLDGITRLLANFRT
ncbi:MAG: DUF4404 family protein [Gammaproteobacteria bacterium]|nr:DUF4404 family protein [Gammaproteobacteria bacterium]